MDGRIYPWGDEFDPSRCNTRESGIGTTTPVGRYSPEFHPELVEGGDSPCGCADMAGNVWEWTQSLCKGYPYDPADGREDPKATGRRVVRGGAFNFDRRWVRCALRLRYPPDHLRANLGFRPVAVPVDSEL
jgi:formylglycine-generating enzyme required for sulfatase activity